PLRTVRHQPLRLHGAEERLHRVLHDGDIVAQRLVHFADARLAAIPQDLQDQELASRRFGGSGHWIESLHLIPAIAYIAKLSFLSDAVQEFHCSLACTRAGRPPANYQLVAESPSY